MGLFTSKYKKKYKKEKKNAAQAQQRVSDVESDRDYYKNKYEGKPTGSGGATSGGTVQEIANERARQMGEDRKASREEGKKYAEEVLSRDIQGLDPKKRSAMEYEANKNIQRQHQSANRKLLGEQSRHGIVGQGGVGYAQQRDLQRLANEGYGQTSRDLDKLDADLALKKLAAMFNIEQGEATQAQLDKQMAIDELKLDDELRRQRNYEDQVNRLFSRV